MNAAHLLDAPASTTCGRGVADAGHGDAGGEVDQGVAVGVDEHAAAGRLDEDRQRGADAVGDVPVPALELLPGARAGDLGDESAFLGEGRAAGAAGCLGHPVSVVSPNGPGPRIRRVSRRGPTGSAVKYDGPGESVVHGARPAGWPGELSSRRRRARLDRVHRHPGAGHRPGEPGPVPGRRADRGRLAARAVPSAGRGVRPGVRRAGRGGLVAGGRAGVRRGAQRHHRRGRAAAHAGRARRRQHAGPGQQGVPDHRRPAGHRAGEAGPDRAGRLRAQRAGPVPARRPRRRGTPAGADRERRPVPRPQPRRSWTTSPRSRRWRTRPGSWGRSSPSTPRPWSTRASR